MSSSNDLINSEKPVLVDFFAEWCGPCKMIAPVLKKVISKVSGRARIIKIDIDRNPMVAAKYGVRSVPTLIIFKKGEIKWRQSGVISAEQLVAIIEKLI